MEHSKKEDQKEVEPEPTNEDGKEEKKDSKRKFIIIMGRSGSGKSEFINFLSRKKVCHTGVGESITKKSECYDIDYPGLKPMTIMDTRGLFDSNPAVSNVDIMLNLLEYCVKTRMITHVDGVLYFLKSKDDRFSSKEVIRFLQETLSKDIEKSMSYLVTMAGALAYPPIRAEFDQLVANGFNGKPYVLWESVYAITADIKDLAGNQIEKLQATIDRFPGFDLNIFVELEKKSVEYAKKLQEQDKITVWYDANNVKISEVQKEKTIVDYFIHEENSSYSGMWNILLIPMLFNDAEETKRQVTDLDINDKMHNINLLNYKVIPIEKHEIVSFEEPIITFETNTGKAITTSKIKFKRFQTGKSSIKYKILITYEYWTQELKSVIEKKSQVTKRHADYKPYLSIALAQLYDEFKGKIYSNLLGEKTKIKVDAQLKEPAAKKKKS